MKLELPKKKESGFQPEDNILIDLMPKSHRDVVRLKHQKKRTMYAVMCVIALCLGVSGTFYVSSIQASSLLTKEKEVQQQIDVAVLDYAEVDTALQNQKLFNDLLYASSGTELNWESILQKTQAALPENTSITSMSVTANDNMNSEVASSILLNLESTDPSGYSDTLRAFTSLEGAHSVTIGGLKSSQENSYSYALSFTYDESVRTNRFAQKEAE